MPLSINVGMGACSSTFAPPINATWCAVIGKPASSNVGSSAADALVILRRTAIAPIGNSFFMEISYAKKYSQHDFRNDFSWILRSSL
jgi:hypothetical protein